MLRSDYRSLIFQEGEADEEAVGARNRGRGSARSGHTHAHRLRGRHGQILPAQLAAAQPNHAF